MHCARQADAGLHGLLAVVLTARADMQTELKSRPPDGRRQRLARARLLGSLEAYASGLAARGLSAPPILRDELALQRNLAGARRHPTPPPAPTRP
jgi:hypothetical protein